MNEQQFLQSYQQDQYDRPSVTADIAAFSLRTVKSDAYRASPELKLCVLLIRRGGHPFKDHWALPGGFLQRGETIDECAFRELKEETGYVSDHWRHLITVPSQATISDNYAYVFAADECEKVSGQNLDDSEFLSTVLLEEKQIEDMIRKGDFPQAVHIMGFMMLKAGY
jgi:ADP-ribose pyrophosphatase YjhB (NUDIX family)